ncbi:MAG: excinuclease ABC subunit A [Candidatus Latescibacterota bacterium]
MSFNSPEGWCLSCEGLGTQRGMGVHTLVPDQKKTLAQGAVLPWGEVDPKSLLGQMVTAIGESAKFDLHTPFSQMPDRAQQAILYGLGNLWLTATEGLSFQFRGLFPAIETLVRQAPRFRRQMGEFIQDVPCPSCRGHRINPVSAAVRLRDRTLPEVVKLPIRDVRSWFDGLDLKGREHEAAGEVLTEIHNRLRFLDEVGLGYIDLARRAPSLSGGEAQRIRLASQIGSGLTGVLYVLDEPTIGLHQRDNRQLLSALQRLRDLGNSLIVVEHDRDTLEAADYVLDFGPGAGTEGGRLVAAGSPKRLALGKGSLTAQYLKHKMRIDVPLERRHSDGRELKVMGARHNNLKQVDVAFPLGLMTCVTGVSGSGKSSLVNDVLYGVLAARVNGAQKAWGEHDDVEGLELVDKVINIDQTPIGYSPRSNPATYVKVFDVVRTLYSNLPDAKVRGFKPGNFSFNHKRGRCDGCRGLGARCIEMHFLPDVWVTCETCGGKRYNRDVVDIVYKGVSIADVLTMTVAEALIHFENVPLIRRSLQTLFDVGLGYIKMGQASTTLSGGEAQRVKLARELARPNTGKTVYILDEPTTGLHFADIQKLLVVLDRLVEAGNTVIVIEHNLDVVKTADWVIDLGPEGGEEGGFVVAEGTPEDVMLVKGSHTGLFLQEVLAQSVVA